MPEWSQSEVGLPDNCFGYQSEVHSKLFLVISKAAIFLDEIKGSMAMFMCSCHYCMYGLLWSRVSYWHSKGVAYVKRKDIILYF